MIRILSLIAAAALIAGPASARDYKINIVGRDDTAVREDIRIAVHSMCQAYNAGTRGLGREQACLSAAARDAEAQLAEARSLAQAKTANRLVAAR